MRQIFLLGLLPISSCIYKKLLVQVCKLDILESCIQSIHSVKKKVKYNSFIKGLQEEMNLFFVFWMSQKKEKRRKKRGGVKRVLLDIMGLKLRLACLATLKTFCLDLNPRICERPGVLLVKVSSKIILISIVSF